MVFEDKAPTKSEELRPIGSHVEQHGEEWAEDYSPTVSDDAREVVEELGEEYREILIRDRVAIRSGLSSKGSDGHPRGCLGFRGEDRGSAFVLFEEILWRRFGADSMDFASDIAKKKEAMLGDCFCGFSR